MEYRVRRFALLPRIETSMSYFQPHNIFENFPQEIVLYILSYLRPPDLLQCSQVNRQLNSLASRDCLWKPFFRAQFPAEYEYISKQFRLKKRMKVERNDGFIDGRWKWLLYEARLNTILDRRIVAFFGCLSKNGTSHIKISYELVRTRHMIDMVFEGKGDALERQALRGNTSVICTVLEAYLLLKTKINRTLKGAWNILSSDGGVHLLVGTQEMARKKLAHYIQASESHQLSSPSKLKLALAHRKADRLLRMLDCQEERSDKAFRLSEWICIFHYERKEGRHCRYLLCVVNGTRTAFIFFTEIMNPYLSRTN